ncbi:unnamed protein product [Caenorhabditis bovis]|uniref:Uncharacterized protein n=1 Tax=Caenorhabditis bovis TaxID=2654633 RepID=A0A8S1EXU2_9PELO|nr:unnamed protein product [Caenorhabditis bovis]
MWQESNIIQHVTLDRLKISLGLVLIEQLKSIADTGVEADLFPYLKRMALDIICETSMGTTVDAQHNHDHPYVRYVTRLNEESFDYLRKPWNRITPIWYLFGGGYRYHYHLNVVTEFTKQVINEKWDEFLAFNDTTDDKDKKKMAFLDLLLVLRKEGQLSLEDIREEVDTFMFEGHDTTSASMGWTLWCIAHNPDVQKKVLDEVDRVFGRSDRDCTDEDLKQLKYLEKCIKESLRLFPSVPLFARKVERDVVINGDLFPKNATILMAPFIIHRNPMWWNEPEKFNPDNFADDAIANRHAYADVPFSAGPRNCIGQKFAVMEEKTCLSWIFRKYTLRTTIAFEKNIPCPEIIIKPSLGFPLIVESRN